MERADVLVRLAGRCSPSFVMNRTYAAESVGNALGTSRVESAGPPTAMILTRTPDVIVSGVRQGLQFRLRLGFPIDFTPAAAIGFGRVPEVGWTTSVP